MKRIFLPGLIAALGLVLSVGTGRIDVCAAASMGSSDGYDLDSLLTQAQLDYDLANEDAVVLLESSRVSIEANGDLRTRIHRVAWVGASAAVRGYADLRIPYNSATSTLTVNKLRTWRDERWWPDTGVSETAVVETLPFALALADDYTTMRETMLLHDGVEVPCIMETDYEIVEHGGAAYGTDGLWVFPQSDPAVRVELTLDVSEGETVVSRSGNGAPEPVVTDGTGGRVTYRWMIKHVPRQGMPHIENSSVAEPYVAWSTWRDWKTLGAMITTSVNEAAVPNAEMTDTLNARLEHEPTRASKARAIAALIDDFVRGIHYDSRFWGFAPRPVSRTWETAYGHGLDRAVLAVALFRGAGFEALPIYRTGDLTEIDADVPGLSWFQGIQVVVKDPKMYGWYDPDNGSFMMGPSPLRACTVWRPDENEQPRFSSPEPNNRFELELTIEPGDGDEWTGSGFVSAEGVFCPYNQMVGADDAALSYIGGVAGSVIDGAEADTFDPDMFSDWQVTGGFGFHAAEIEPDAQGRTVVLLGAPAGGIATRLPSDVHLYNEKRTSPVVLVGSMTQRVTVRLNTGDRDVVQLPPPCDLENKAGRFTLHAEQKDGWVTIDRELRLESGMVPPEMWPDLRALLLEDADAAGRAIYLK